MVFYQQLGDARVPEAVEPVEIDIGDLPHHLGLFRGSSVRVLIWF